jgi:hypothetical protein
MTAVAIRKELQGYIAAMPERELYALKPLLSVLAEPLYTVEAASAEEITMIDERISEYRADPSSFVPMKKTQKTGRWRNG